jgi:hypothetical protein
VDRKHTPSKAFIVTRLVTDYCHKHCSVTDLCPDTNLFGLLGHESNVFYSLSQTYEIFENVIFNVVLKDCDNNGLVPAWKKLSFSIAWIKIVVTAR